VFAAGIFAAAAVGKQADRAGSRDAVRGFGAAVVLAVPLAILVPVVEFATTAAVAAAATAWYGALTALAALAGYLIALAENLPDAGTPCRRFGARDDRPSARTLARTGTLAVLAGALAALCAGAAGPDPLARTATPTPSDMLALASGAAMLGLFAGGVPLAVARRDRHGLTAAAPQRAGTPTATRTRTPGQRHGARTDGRCARFAVCRPRPRRAPGQLRPA
jgi:hypothetical protein